MNFNEIEKKTGYTFKDKRLLKRAFTLASANPTDNNQRLEFFGDAILEFLVSEHIYDEHKSEGELTELRKAYVSDSALTPISEKLGLENYFIKSTGDVVLKKSIPSAYEALIAAIYLDGGIDEARAFFLRTMDFTSVSPPVNYKGELQEIMQGECNVIPVYKNEDIGTPSKPCFRASVTVFGKIFSGEGDNKKQAEQSAAQSALEYLKSKHIAALE